MMLSFVRVVSLVRRTAAPDFDIAPEVIRADGSMGVVPPCFDAYVWVEPADRAATLRAFLDAYVDQVRPGDSRFEAFVRTYVDESPHEGDREALAELRRDDALQVDDCFSLYLRARNHFDAIVTLTRDGAVVLGLSLDDPYGRPAVGKQALKLAKALMAELDAVAAMGGIEVPPPQSRQEWADAARTEFRIGDVG
ncbi:hypothetical protein [Aeromicrobium sp. Root236]|uniref:hypothetical protein n=1 Tax=Aeromicrobium sp. Root236 TaxID=1736498 RepID=UPI0012FBE77E|nr:hypothetical protein [Aeromicrobium sp. Root236]